MSTDASKMSYVSVALGSAKSKPSANESLLFLPNATDSMSFGSADVAFLERLSNAPRLKSRPGTMNSKEEDIDLVAMAREASKSLKRGEEATLMLPKALGYELLTQKGKPEFLQKLSHGQLMKVDEKYRDRYLKKKEASGAITPSKDVVVSTVMSLGGSRASNEDLQATNDGVTEMVPKKKCNTQELHILVTESHGGIQ
jgi:hypothetical protein